jgi:hypothetical protein
MVSTDRRFSEQRRIVDESDSCTAVQPDRRFASRGSRLAAGCPPPFTAGGWRLAAGGWRLAAGGWRKRVLETGNWKLETGNWKLETETYRSPAQ